MTDTIKKLEKHRRDDITFEIIKYLKKGVTRELREATLDDTHFRFRNGKMQDLIFVVWQIQ